MSQLLTLLAGVLATCITMAFLLAYARLRPPRLTDARALYFLKRLSPEDLGIAFDTMHFSVPERGRTGTPIRLAAWYVRHPEAAGRLVVLIHGYSDAKVGTAAWLPMLHALKVNVLLLDLPAHGESEGNLSTAGWYERYQVPEVIRQIRQAKPGEAEQVVLFGISQGAAVALSAASVDESITAVIADSPYANVRVASVLHADLFGLPGAMLQRTASWIIERLWGIAYDDIAPMNLLRSVPCPVLLIEAGRDALVTREDAELMRDAVMAKSHKDGKSRLLVIAGAPHILGLAVDPEQYTAAVAGLLNDIT